MDFPTFRGRSRWSHEAKRVSFSTGLPDRGVLIRFPDGLHALFRFAFAIADEATGEVAVFTEHCGYHIFSTGDAEVQALQSVWR